MHTLLRYPGGKSRAVKILKEFIPKDVDAICSPFFGGGALEIALANEGIKVHGFDVFEPLVEFWQSVIDKPQLLREEVYKHHPISKEGFKHLQSAQSSLDSLIERAAAFYVLNRSSFSGATLSGGMSPDHPRFTTKSIENLITFNAKNIEVKKLDFEESIGLHPDTFLYCDPPYVIKSHLYGNKGSTHKNFDHERLASILKSRGNWVLSYNNCDYIHDLYEGYHFEYPHWSYGMGADKDSKEVIILSKY